jgi:hypothetical protein
MCLMAKMLAFLFSYAPVLHSSCFSFKVAAVSQMWAFGQIILKTKQANNRKQALSPAPQYYLEKALAFFSINYKHYKNSNNCLLMVKCCHWSLPLSFWHLLLPLRSGNPIQSQYFPLSSLGYRGQWPHGFIGILVLPSTRHFLTLWWVGCPL